MSDSIQPRSRDHQLRNRTGSIHNVIRYRENHPIDSDRENMFNQLILDHQTPRDRVQDELDGTMDYFRWDRIYDNVNYDTDVSKWKSDIKIVRMIERSKDEAKKDLKFLNKSCFKRDGVNYGPKLKKCVDKYKDIKFFDDGEVFSNFRGENECGRNFDCRLLLYNYIKHTYHLPRVYNHLRNKIKTAQHSKKAKKNLFSQ